MDISSFSNWKKRGGGVILYTKSAKKVKTLYTKHAQKMYTSISSLLKKKTKKYVFKMRKKRGRGANLFPNQALKTTKMYIKKRNCQLMNTVLISYCVCRRPSWKPKTQPNGSSAVVWLSFWFSTRFTWK